MLLTCCPHWPVFRFQRSPFATDRTFKQWFEQCCRNLEAVRNERLLLEQRLPNIVDVVAIIGAVVTSSWSNVRAVSLRTKRDHTLVDLQQKVSVNCAGSCDKIVSAEEERTILHMTVSKPSW